MSEFNFAENEQINAFAHELGTILRRIARQDNTSTAREALPIPIETQSFSNSFELNTNPVEVGCE